MPAGQPPYFKTPEELVSKSNEYFSMIVESKEPPTITGLCLFLGFESRQSFYDYQERTEFSYAIKRLRMTIECEYEKALSKQSCTGAIFALKNMGWVDSQSLDHTTNGKAMTGLIVNVKPEE